MHGSVMKAERALVALEESLMFLILVIQMSNKAEPLVEKVPNTRKNALQNKGVFFLSSLN